MRALIGLHNRIFSAISGLAGSWLLPTLARFTFAATLLGYFWRSAGLKLDGYKSVHSFGEFWDFILSGGFLRLSFGSYGQVLPQKYEAVGYDPSLLSFLDKTIVYAGTYAELLLPLLLVIGLFTRLAAFGMIGFVAVLTYVDIFGHHADPVTIGAWFDRIQDSQIMDQRLFWFVIFVTIIVRGAGPISVDRFIGVK